MIIALTGTPGTGKTTVAKILRKRGFKVIDLNRIILREKLYSGYDERRKCYIVDMKKLERYISKYTRENIVFLDSHVSHLLNVDLVIVLRCSPKELEKRLRKKKWRSEKIRENIEAEIVEIITIEAEEKYGRERVIEIDTTGKSPEKVVEEIIKIINKVKSK